MDQSIRKQGTEMTIDDLQERKRKRLQNKWDKTPAANPRYGGLTILEATRQLLKDESLSVDHKFRPDYASTQDVVGRTFTGSTEGQARRAGQSKCQLNI